MNSYEIDTAPAQRRRNSFNNSSSNGAMVSEVLSSLNIAPPAAKSGADAASLDPSLQRVMATLVQWTDFPSTINLTSFGATGVVIIDLLHRANLLSHVTIVFIDTLHHFKLTYMHVKEMRKRYPEMDLRCYKPKGCETEADFDRLYGADLWETDPDQYAYLTKVEPRDRAMNELNAKAYINGRRASQGNERAKLKLVEEDADSGILRIQPLYDWTYEQCWQYIREHDVPYNRLYDRGYKSIGDRMTTFPVDKDAPERSGRWANQNQHRTECGLHTVKTKTVVAANNN